MRDAIIRFLRDERGATMLEAVLYVGIISLPLVTFLAIFGRDLINWIKEHAPRIFDEGARFLG
jgi:Flp pilus assembly pilin Flp